MTTYAAGESEFFHGHPGDPWTPEPEPDPWIELEAELRARCRSEGKNLSPVTVSLLIFQALAEYCGADDETCQAIFDEAGTREVATPKFEALMAAYLRETASGRAKVKLEPGSHARRR